MIKNPDNDSDEMALFHTAMRDVVPLPASNRISPETAQISPIPRRKPQQQETIEDSLSDHLTVEIAAGDDWSFARPSVPRQTLRRLRRGHWEIQAELDLHGLTRDEARQELSAFLNACAQKRYRCICVVHGKGISSKNREPVLKTRIGNWLLQRNDVLAFCQAKPEHGGSGALLILLKADTHGQTIC